MIDAKRIDDRPETTDTDFGRVFDFTGNVFLCFSEKSGENKRIGFGHEGKKESGGVLK